MKSNTSAAKVHQSFNDFFSIGLVVLALYMLVLPLWPHVSLWWEKQNDTTEGFTYQTRLIERDEANAHTPPPEPIPQDNRLVLPTIRLDEAVHEGTGSWALNKGLWRRPHTNTPDQGGNTVIVGHRFTYDSPSVFFHLDKIKVGDKFPLYWDGVEYNYEVTEVKVVSPLAVEIENQTERSILTLYTCTPIWTSKNRLVIVSQLIEEPA